MTYTSNKDSIGKTIKTVMEKNGISLYRMAKDLGIAYESLYRSLDEDGNPRWKRIKEILEYLSYEIALKPKGKKTQKTPRTSKPKRQRGK